MMLMYAHAPLLARHTDAFTAVLADNSSSSSSIRAGARPSCAPI